jgi:S-adenosylmethionine:tRNA ribosyltransferase-isomerase
LRTSDFDYELPTELIAQRPANPRDSSRLMLLHRGEGSVEHHRFHDLPALLRKGDALIANESRVIPARLSARKQPGGGRAEVLLLARRGPATWQALVGGSGMLPGRRIAIEGGPGGVVVEDLGGATRLIRFDEGISDQLDRIGVPPLPPYIREPILNPDEYQTVYARQSGSAAAPTAGLHFTVELLDELEQRGVSILTLTLHIGLDTFLPVAEETPASHPIHSEWCRIDRGTIEALEQTHENGGRVIAIGTTSVRALETAARESSKSERLTNYKGSTDLFILPGHEFQAVDGLITNFHLPRSTLLMLVSAFAGREQILRAYEVAKAERYRFYSFGDAMLIL